MNPKARGRDFNPVELIGFRVFEALRIARPKRDLDACVKPDDYAVTFALVAHLLAMRIACRD